ncbi:hypothetical protein [Planctomicrobium sp. SH664]|uniref:hypothetical protein n=1 Tax=Planctomicrobium sp. SH664 TaxID=3448125 RepID=UPI003F5BB9FD
MSLLIMGLGIVPIFTLFPLCVASSIRATELTNSKLLVDNVKELTRMMPAMLVPPADNSTWSDGLNVTWRGDWKPNTTYAVNEVIIPNLPPGQLFPQPNAILRCTTAGTSGAGEPQWNLSGATIDGTAQWTVINPVTNPEYYNYVVDPVGLLVSTAYKPHIFGNRESTSEEPAFELRRTNAFDGTRMNSGLSGKTDAIFRVIDSYTTDLSFVPASVSSSMIQAPAGVDLAGIPPKTSVYLYNSNRTKNVRREVDIASSNSFTIAGGPIPTGYDAYVKVESYQPRYSSLLAVHFNGFLAQPEVSCAVFFNRNYSLDAEYVYKANFGNYAFNADTDVKEPTLSLDQVLVFLGGGAPQPNLKEGGYVFDARQARFYKIVHIKEGTNSAILTLDRPCMEQTIGTTANDVGQAILMPRIVTVYNF